MSKRTSGCVRKPGNTIKRDCKDKEPGATDINKSNSTLSTQATGIIFPSALKIQQSPVHSFEFLEKDYYEQCHFINVVNLFNYMEEKNFVNTLQPFLRIKNIDEYVEGCVNKCDHKIDIVNEILKEECALKIKGCTDISTDFVLRYCETPILYETPNEKVICIYRSQIFDATQSETVIATTDEFKKLDGKRKKLCNIYKYYKLTWDKIKSSNKSSSDVHQPSAILSHVHKPSVLPAAGRGRGRGLSNLPAWMTKQNNGSIKQLPGDKKPSATLFRGKIPLEASGLNNMSESALGIHKSKVGWGGNTIKGGCKDEVQGATLSDVQESSVLSAAGRGQGTGLSNQPALVNKLQNQSNEKLPRDRDVIAGDGEKAAEQHCKVAKPDKAEAANAKAEECTLLKQKDKENSKAEVAAKGMKNVERNTTKDAVETSKVDGEATFVIHDGVKDKSDRQSAAMSLCDLSGSTTLHCNESAPTTPETTAPVPKPNLPVVEMYAPVAETDKPMSTHINDPKAAPTKEHFKEVAPVKVNDKDDARLSETKEKSESEENSTKVADKTTAMKDIFIAREGIEKVESKTKEAEYDAKVDNEDILAAKSEKKAAAEEHCKGSEVEGDEYPTRYKKG